MRACLEGRSLFLNWSDSRYCTRNLWSWLLGLFLKLGYSLAAAWWRYDDGMMIRCSLLDMLYLYFSTIGPWNEKEISRNRVHYCIIPRNWWGLRVLLWIQSLVYNINLHNRYNLQWASTRSPMPVLWGYPFYSSRIIHLLVLASCLSRASGAILKRRRDSRRKCPSWLLYTE